MSTQKVLIIARYTLKELLKSKILYITGALGCAIILITFIATEFTYGVPEKVALDFGLGMLSLSSLAIAVFMGATLLPNEIDSRTVYMVISRPVSRKVFILGKILGLVGVLSINIMFLSVLTLACSALLGGEINPLIIAAIFFNLIEAVLVVLLVVLFSLFMNSILSSATALVLLILGHAVKETQGLVFVESREYLKILLKTYHNIFPSFYKLNLKDFVIYQQQIDGSYLFSMATYGVLYSMGILFLILVLFDKKNLD